MQVAPLPLQKAATGKNSSAKTDSFGSSQSEEVRVAGLALRTSQQSITGFIVGVVLIGFVVMNAKQRNPN